MRPNVLVVLWAGCGGTNATPAQPAAPELTLSDLQKECRATRALQISQDGLNLGPTCDHEVGSMALHLFDLGSELGEVEGNSWLDAHSAVCVCAHTKCTDQMALDVTERARDVMVTNDRKALRDSESHLMTTLSGHSCLIAGVAVAIVEEGYGCAFVGAQTGVRGATRRQDFFRRIAGEAEAVRLFEACPLVSPQ